MFRERSEHGPRTQNTHVHSSQSVFTNVQNTADPNVFHERSEHYPTRVRGQLSTQVGRVSSPLSSDDESDASVCDSDPDLTQQYSLPPSVLDAVEARRGRVGGLS